jgi:hypothetical protein
VDRQVCWNCGLPARGSLRSWLFIWSLFSRGRGGQDGHLMRGDQPVDNYTREMMEITSFAMKNHFLRNEPKPRSGINLVGTRGCISRLLWEPTWSCRVFFRLCLTSSRRLRCLFPCRCSPGNEGGEDKGIDFALNSNLVRLVL